MTNEGNWYKITDAAQIDTPALLLYPQRAIQNIELLKAMVSSPDLLRPHVKTHKSVDISRLIIKAGISKFKCATIAEAEMLGQAGAADVLLAYQPTQTKLERLIKLMAIYPNTKYSCLVDNAVTAAMISEQALKKQIIIPVFIDLNVGMDRTGIAPAKALELFGSLQQLKGVSFMGFHAYDGHINDINFTDRLNNCNKEFAPVEALRAEIERQGYPFPLMVAGGSPTFAVQAMRKNTECSPGTFIYWDKGYSIHIPEQPFLFAALVLTRIVSLPDDTKICIDMGYKAITCEHSLPHRGYFLNAPHLKSYSQSEEHLVIEVEKGHNYKIGDLFYVLPYHVCPTVAMYNNAYVIEGGHVTGKWTITARGRELSV